jgi:hypothetical protein
MKKLCEAGGKELERHVESLAEAGRKPGFVCRKCARAAMEKEALCKPVKIKSPKQKGSA